MATWTNRASKDDVLYSSTSKQRLAEVKELGIQIELEKQKLRDYQHKKHIEHLLQLRRAKNEDYQEQLVEVTEG